METTIQAFIQDTGSGQFRSEPQPDHTNIQKNDRTTRTINRKNLTTTLEKILTVNGSGVLRELTVVADQKINLVLKIDGNHMFGEHSDWDDFSQISVYSNTVMAQTSGSNYILNLKDIYFNKSIDIKIQFNTQASISSVFGVYDVYHFT